METICIRLITPGLIDSRLKLQLLLLFHQQPHLCGDAQSVTNWLHENPWAVSEALDALVDAKFLDRIERQGCTLYRLEPSIGNRMRLNRLALCYDDPFRRDKIYALVRIADDERQFRAFAIGEQRDPTYIVW